MEVIGHVSEFTQSGDDVDRILDYPGRRPTGSFISDGTMVYRMPDTHEEFVAAAGDMLAASDLPGLEDRTPVLAYGANASPARLRRKLAAIGSQNQNLMQTVPTETAGLPGMLAVWHGRPGQTGGCFAELYPADTPEASLRAHVSYLTTEQLAALHITEGVTYSAAEVRAEAGSGESLEVITALAYVALKATVLLEDDKPVLVHGLQNVGSGLPSKTAAEAVQYMLDGVAADIGRTDVRDYIAAAQKLSLAEKKARQDRIGQLLMERGLSREFIFPVPDGGHIGRADFSSVPGGHSKQCHAVPEMLLGAVRPVEAEMAPAISKEMIKKPELSFAQARRNVQDRLDPARRISKRAHNELNVRLQLADRLSGSK